MSGNILVVDPDRTSRDSLSQLLGVRALRVVTVETGAQALDEARRDTFELVLSDMVLPPAIDALNLVARLRERDADQEIILLGSRPDARGQALRAGVSDFLLKPFEPSELALAVDRCLERAILRRERARLLDENLQFARTQSIHQRCLELLANPDLEWLQERVIADLAALCDAQSAAIWLVEEKGELTLRAYRGLSDRQHLSERIAADAPQAARICEGKPWIGGEPRAQVLWVPLETASEAMGLVQLADPLSGEFRPEHLQAAKTLADFAGVAVKNGKRLFALQRLGLKDRETAAYNLSYFVDYASKEIYKARRYGRTFSLLTFSIDNLPQARTRLGVNEAKRAPRGIIRALSRIVRDSDVIARASEQEFYLLLPETDSFGSMMFIRRAMASVREEAEVQEIEARLPLGLVGGGATFPKDGEDFDELIYRCRHAMDERRASLQRKLVLEPMAFWEQVELLLGNPDSPKLPVDERAEPSRRGKVSDQLFEELQTEIARELMRDPGSRGVLYVGVPEIRSTLPIVLGMEAPPHELASRVYLLGRRADLESHPGLTPVFLEGDERISRHEFLFWISEHSAYGLVQRRGVGATWGFHTSDTAVVDGLVSKLQAEYDLQPY